MCTGMRAVIAPNIMSLDGFYEAPGGIVMVPGARGGSFSIELRVRVSR